MAAPVWVLSVDLQTKTATFQSGMAEAAKSARTAFTDIKGGASEMGDTVGGTSGSARQAVMLLGDEFGIHLPRGLTTFIASLGPVGAAMEAAFPFVAIALGATLLIQHLAKLKAAGIELTEDQVKFGNAVQNAYNVLDSKMLQAGKRADELRGDHLGALSKELQIIDHTNMDDLIHSFGEVAKSADVVFKGLESRWYEFGTGSTGAKNALHQFQTQYESLLLQGKDKEATDLLRGTRESAEKTLAMQKQAAGAFPKINARGQDHSAQLAFGQANNELLKAGVGYSEKEIQAVQALIGALNSQLEIEQKVAAISKIDKGNATGATNKTMGEEAAKRAREMAEFAQKGVDEESRIIREGNAKLGADIVEGEREKIAATETGSAARLAAIDSAIKYEAAAGMESTSNYRELLTARVNLVRQMSEEEKKLRVEAAKEATDNEMKMGELALAAQKEQTALADSSRRVSASMRVAEETAAANQMYAIKLMALQRDIAALDSSGKDYDNKLQAILNKETQLIKAHENEVTAIKDKAEMERNSKILSAEQHFNDTVAAGMTQVFMGHKSFASQMTSLGNQVVTGMMENALKSVLANDFTKESDAAAAARKMYLLGAQFPWPVGAVMGPVLGAMAFASVMAFQDGTDSVPGIGKGDKVPAMLEPGEGVVPGGVMDNLRNMARSGTMGGGTHYHAHVNPTYNLQALDTSGMEAVLNKHHSTLEKHVANTFRKMNR